MALIGLEDELMVVDAAGALVAHDFERSWQHMPGSQAWLKREMHAATMELLTDPAPHPAPVLAQLHQRRKLAATWALPQEQRLLTAGLHPTARPWGQAVHSHLNPHYAALQTEYGAVAQGALSFGLHLHLGLPEPAQRVHLYRLLRERLPLFMATSANAPFSEGQDTGLASFRHSWLGRYPRMGVPPDFETPEQAQTHLDRLRRTGCIHQDAGLWYDLRLHHRLPTVELRALDAHSDLRRVEHLASWTLAWAWMVEQGRAPALPKATPTPLIEENHWRARRHGASAKLIDWPTDSELPLQQALQVEAEVLAPALQHLGLRERFEWGLQGPEPATHQRNTQAESGWSGLMDRLAAETLQPC
ncbi:MAG: YbdK family carboxylate-amine ligase [Burkholderiales bacterium]